MLNDIEDDEEVQELNFQNPENNNYEQIDKNIDNMLNDPIENLKIIIKNFLIELNAKDISEELISKAIKVYNEVGFINLNNGIDILKIIFKEAVKFSNFNLNKRLIDFFDFLLSILNLNYNYIITSLKITVRNLNKDNKKDIILFWKESIIEQYLKDKGIFLKTQISKDILKLLLEYNYNLSEIYSILDVFKYIINDNNFTQYEMIYSLISIIIAYPKANLDALINYLKNYIRKNINQNNKSLFFDPKIALDFYLKASSDINSAKDNSELTIPEIFNRIKILNPDISDNIIRRRESQLNIIHSTISNPSFKNYEKSNFQEWVQNDFPFLEFDEKNSDSSIATVLGMISLVIKKDKGYYLRNTQLIAILMFIGKDEKYGLIEEISTGEGKSCIICSLSIFFALRKHKVDIISSGYTLAQRDSEEFKNIYDYFNLTTAFPYNSESWPYSCDILYGTFLEFEGDYLREITTTRKTRNNRPYDVIIIDEVDNLFIDNILGSTRLTNSSMGCQFLVPIYLSTYISFELTDFFFLLFFKINLKSHDKEKKKKFELLISNPIERKKELINTLSEIYDNIFSNKNNEKEIMKQLTEKEKKIIHEKSEDLENFVSKNDLFKNLEKNLEYPDFLNSFVISQYPYWIDSAYDAKNQMTLDKDYVLTNSKKEKDIAPVDRNNTGEIEMSTVYDNGLHQMLEIKHLLRIKNETFVHTFLSHITFFQKYRKEKQFLFFGLTGTIGDTETQKIYQNNYFNSKILFIPQYKQKRFVELPPKLCKITEHIDEICKDIIINFHKGRKILVICTSIKEAKFIEEKLKKFKTETLINDIKVKKDKNINDYKSQIILYTRNDNYEKHNIKEKKKIFLSTNLGGRGTDLQTNEEEEKNGGLHVIITDIPSNSRVLKQAFGRTSREGKKGTGQMILKNTGYNSYSELLNEMNRTEMNKIKKNQKEIKILLFKDKLFEDFCEIAKDIDDPNSYLYDDINERWAYFLKSFVKEKEGNNLDEKEIKSQFENFKFKIKQILQKPEPYEKFQNPFYKMQEGLKLYKEYEEKLNKYFDIKEEKKKFYFTQPYIQAIITIVNAKVYNKEFFEDVIKKFNDSIKRINLLLEESINPLLDSFKQWGCFVNHFKFQIEGFEEYKQEMDKLIIEDYYESSELYIQYKNIKNIFERIINRIEMNIKFFEEKIYIKDKKNYQIFVTVEELDEGLSIDEKLKKELDYFYSASFYFVYKFSIRRKTGLLKTIFWQINLICFIVYIVGFILNPIVTGIAAVGFFIGNIALFKYGYDKYKDVEINDNSVFANLLKIIIRKFSNRKDDRSNRLLNFQQHFRSNNDINIIHSSKNYLFSKILENVEIKFNEIKKIDIIKFLLFIDNYMSEAIWQEKIKDIIYKSFKNIYEVKFLERIDIFGKNLTDDNIIQHLNNYNEIFEMFFNQIINEFRQLSQKKEYNEKTGLNCLEHLIMNLNSEKITEDIAKITVNYMLYFNLITNDGTINENLFEDCFIIKENKNKKKLHQNFKINIINKLSLTDKVVKISNLKQFQVTGLTVPMVDSSFIDLANFYKKNNYNVSQQLEKDYCLFIINNFKAIINSMLLMDESIFESFYKMLLNFIKKLIKNLIEEKIFTSQNQKSIENVISDNLSNEEKVEFRKMIKEAGQKALKLIKNK